MNEDSIHTVFFILNNHAFPIPAKLGLLHKAACKHFFNTIPLKTKILRETFIKADYENSFLDIMFIAPDGYSMLEDEDNDMITELFAQSSSTTYGFNSEMMCYAPEGLPILFFASTKLLNSSSTLDDFIVDSALSDSVTAEDTTIAGINFSKFTDTTDMDDTELILDMYLSKWGKKIYMIYIAYLANQKEAADAMLNGFQAK